ncbi:metal dependent phosphohydrolase [Humitalea rosea]|uniref:Metal dependent phosphohydrolase n=1 Tax=Humitalea rosea TaxID=990373 RepID=A0A2W7ISU9_9PROT|nr:HD domain-containing protein [Humitalea rosea]PZW50926.1 metal dependent phosphohydrolase [Humitalea rosea]
MSEPRTQRVRDPVHGLIVFRADDRVDQLAWALLDTPEFQRLRRIRQLGVSEFVFPSATHTRFAHCIGVFHTARTLVRIIERELKAAGQEIDADRAEVAVIAALLHDLGHGPFSHTFEGVQKSRDVAKRHETWTAEVIRNPAGKIRPLLDAHWPSGGFCDAVADLLEAEDPVDIYHAVVSSSFDADRLDYLRRDRLMTGTGAGAIDFDWLMEQVRVRDIEIEAADPGGSGDQARIPTFCFDPKALPAAEQFLLARYTLHEQVYFHKTTRCIEQMIAKLLRRVAGFAIKPATVRQTGLDKTNPLIRFFAKDGATLENYLMLDDVAVTEAIQHMRQAPDQAVADLAGRLLDRRLYKSIDIGSFGYDDGLQHREARRIDNSFKTKLDAEQIIKDEGASVSIYTQIGGDDERAHKKLHILDAKEGPVEITKISKIINELRHPKKFTRYYFENESDRELARQQKGKTA